MLVGLPWTYNRVVSCSGSSFPPKSADVAPGGGGWRGKVWRMARLLPSGDTALVVELGDTVDRGISGQVLALADRIDAAQIPGIVELVPTFRSLMVHFDPVVLAGAELRSRIAALLPGLEAAEPTGRDWVLPACYEGEHAPDLEHIAKETGLATGEVIRLHSETNFLVYCLGFLPGYPYMGDLPAELELPRRAVPRVSLPMGSVCIAMRLTGIYSLESPGGWHLLARTPVRLFDRRRDDAVLLRPGDRVRFAPISAAEFERLDGEAAAGELTVEPVAGSPLRAGAAR